MRPCPRCGTPVESANRFCSRCGLDLETPTPPGGHPQPAAPPTYPPQLRHGARSPRRRRVLIGLGIGAVVVVAGLVAALVIPRALNADALYGVAPAMAQPPAQVTPWQPGMAMLPGADNPSDAGLIVMLDSRNEGGSVAVHQIEPARMLWQATLPGKCYYPGRKGTLTCLSGNQVAMYDLRTGRQTGAISLALSGTPQSVIPLPEGGLVVALGQADSRTTGAATAWARVDDKGRPLWQTSLPEGGWYSPKLHGNVLLVDRPGRNQGSPRIAVARSLSDGQPLPLVPDSIPMITLPGDELLMGSNPAVVFDKEGRFKPSLPGTAGHAFFGRAASDGSVHVYATTDDKGQTVIWDDKGTEMARNRWLLAVCDGTVLTRANSSTRSLSGDRIGIDGDGNEVLRVSITTGAEGSLGCDGRRFVEVSSGSALSEATITAYDRAGISWQLPVTVERGEVFGDTTSEGVLIYSYPDRRAAGSSWALFR